MPGPFADYWIATPAQVPLSTTEKNLATIQVPNAVTGMVGLIQVQVHTENTSGLKAVLKINGKNVFTYGPSSTNMSQAVILSRVALYPGSASRITWYMSASKHTITPETSRMLSTVL